MHPCQDGEEYGQAFRTPPSKPSAFKSPVGGKDCVIFLLHQETYSCKIILDNMFICVIEMGLYIFTMGYRIHIPGMTAAWLWDPPQHDKNVQAFMGLIQNRPNIIWYTSYRSFEYPQLPLQDSVSKSLELRSQDSQTTLADSQADSEAPWSFGQVNVCVCTCVFFQVVKSELSINLSIGTGWLLPLCLATVYESAPYEHVQCQFECDDAPCQRIVL